MKNLLNNLDITESIYFNAFLLFVSFILIAKLVDIIIVKIVRRLVTRTKWQLDDTILTIFHKPIFYSILIIGMFISVTYLNPPAQVKYYLKGIFYTLLSVIWGVSISKTFNVILENVARKEIDVTGLKKDIIPLLENVMKVIIVVGVLFVIFSAWKINITPLMASAGIAGAAVAFAAKDTIANFFGGLSIFIDKPYKIGDYVILESGERGEVVNIGIRSSRIKTRDDILITIPNSYMANSKIVNESAPIQNFRVRLPVGISYESNLEQAEEVLLRIAEGTEHVIKEPSPRVRYRRFGDSAIELELLCWIDRPVNKGRTLHQLIKNIHRGFKSENIVIPFPQRDIHLPTKEKRVIGEDRDG